MCLLWTLSSGFSPLHNVGGAVFYRRRGPVPLRVSWRGWDRFSNMDDNMAILRFLHWHPGSRPGQSWQFWLTESLQPLFVPSRDVAFPADFSKITLQKGPPKDLRILGSDSLLCHFLNRVSVFSDQSSLLFRWTPRCCWRRLSWCLFPGCPPV